MSEAIGSDSISWCRAEEIANTAKMTEKTKKTQQTEKAKKTKK